MDIFFSDAIMVAKVTAYIWEKYWCVAFPVSRICLPDHFPLFFFIVNTYKFCSMVVNCYPKELIFHKMCHINLL